MGNGSSKAPEAERPRSAGRLVSVDLLRGVAVLLVVIAHLRFSWRGVFDDGKSEAFPAWLAQITDYGVYGVNLFLVLSGFCIHMGWARKMADVPPHFVAFWKRRLYRLYPPYFAALVCTVIALTTANAMAGRGHAGVTGLLGYASTSQLILDMILLLFLLQNLNDAGHRIGNGPFWTLALEEQLYALYFALLYFRRRFGWLFAISLTFVVSVLWHIVGISLQWPGWWYAIGPARWFEWSLGALAVEAYLGRTTLPAWILSGWLLPPLLGAAILLTRLAADQHHPLFAVGFVTRDLSFGLVFFSLINLAWQHERSTWVRTAQLARFLAWLGLFSYSVYLVHAPVMVTVKRLAISLGVDSVAAIVAARFIGSMIVSYIFFRLIEERFLLGSRTKAGQPREPHALASRS
jgi:peptidoglycan/LPS O-acetylase OafA/YrhL